MHLYHLTLQKAGAITKAIFGNFSGKNEQEFVAVRGHTLDLLRPDEVRCVARCVFGTVCRVCRACLLGLVFVDDMLDETLHGRAVWFALAQKDVR